MQELDFLRQYTDAAREATNRTRQILLVMVIASILVFAAYWNSRSDGWVATRLALARATHDLLNKEGANLKEKSLRWEMDDLVNPAELCRALKENKDPLSDYLRSQFTPNTRGLLGKYAPPQQPSKELVEAIIYEFNRLRQSPSLYEKARFTYVRPRPETEALLAKGARGDDPWGVNRLLLNRLLLEDAYPGTIASNRETPMPPAVDTPPYDTPERERQLHEKAKTFAYRYPSKSVLQAEQALFWAQKIRSEQISQIQVPVIGTSFDVNDLGMLGGVTFVVLLIWVNYSLWHQSNNLRLAFDFARELDEEGAAEGRRKRILYHTYQNLAMHQVLTIPPQPGPEPSESDQLKMLIQKGSKLLYVLPLLVQILVVWHDWQTKQTGYLINEEATTIVLRSGTFLVIVILGLTVLCFSMWLRTYRTWIGVAKEVAHCVPSREPKPAEADS